MENTKEYLENINNQYAKLVEQGVAKITRLVNLTEEDYGKFSMPYNRLPQNIRESIEYKPTIKYDEATVEMWLDLSKEETKVDLVNPSNGHYVDTIFRDENPSFFEMIDNFKDTYRNEIKDIFICSNFKGRDDKGDLEVADYTLVKTFNDKINRMSEKEFEHNNDYDLCMQYEMEIEVQASLNYDSMLTDYILDNTDYSEDFISFYEDSLNDIPLTKELDNVITFPDIESIDFHTVGGGIDPNLNGFDDQIYELKLVNGETHYVDIQFKSENVTHINSRDLTLSMPVQDEIINMAREIYQDEIKCHKTNHTKSKTDKSKEYE